jgi:hypothetical protein
VGNNPVIFTDPFGLLAELDGESDCRKVQCPSLRAIAGDTTVARVGTDLLAASQRDGAERGVFLFNGPNGTIRAGDVIVGKPGTVDFGKAPDDAIGVLHTHPDVAQGIRGGPPSGDDANYVKNNHINGVAEERDFRHFQPWQNWTIYYTVAR